MSQEVAIIDFHDDKIYSTMIDGKPHVVLKPALESIGVDAATQIAKLKTRSWATTGLCPVVGADSKIRMMVTADVRTFLMLLATIDEGRVPEGPVRDKLIQYQAEVADVIEAHWTQGEPPRELTRLELLQIALKAEEDRLAAEAALSEANERVHEVAEQLAIVGPDAGAWQMLASTGDDWLVEDVARILNRDPAIETGPGRLWKLLYEWDVMTRFRERPQPRQEYIDRGYFRVRIVTYPDPKGTGTPKSAPQVRITYAGIVWLHKKLGGSDPVDGLVYGL